MKCIIYSVLMMALALGCASWIFAMTFNHACGWFILSAPALAALVVAAEGYKSMLVAARSSRVAKIISAMIVALPVPIVTFFLQIAFRMETDLEEGGFSTATEYFGMAIQYAALGVTVAMASSAIDVATGAERSTHSEPEGHYTIGLCYVILCILVAGFARKYEVHEVIAGVFPPLPMVLLLGITLAVKEDGPRAWLREAAENRKRQRERKRYEEERREEEQKRREWLSSPEYFKSQEEQKLAAILLEKAKHQERINEQQIELERLRLRDEQLRLEQAELQRRIDHDKRMEELKEADIEQQRLERERSEERENHRRMLLEGIALVSDQVQICDMEIEQLQRSNLDPDLIEEELSRFNYEKQILVKELIELRLSLGSIV